MTNMERACIGCKVRGRYLQPGGYTYTACNSQGKRISLGAPLEAVLSIEEDTPADAFTGVFPWKSIYEELEPVFLEICGGGEVVFFGPVDELQRRFSSEGCMLEIVARSMAALLLDNEAIPQTYAYPSLPLLFERHGKPYGFTEWEGEPSGFSVPFTITKGMSEWEVLSLFCSRYLKVSLRARGKRLEALEERKEEFPLLQFGREIPILECSAEDKMCERYSEILVKPENTETFALSVFDGEAKSLGIRRRRLLSGSTELAREALVKAARRAFCAEVLSPGLPEAGVGAAVCLTLPNWGKEISGLYVSGLRYSLSSSGERCRYTLRKKEVDV